MSDQRLRELERRWRETGLPQDEAAWLLARVRAGDLSRVQLELASLLGHAGARAAVGLAPGADLASKLRRFGDDVLLRAGYLAAEGVGGGRARSLAIALRGRAGGAPTDPAWLDAAAAALRAPERRSLRALAAWALGGADPLAALLEARPVGDDAGLWTLPPEVRAASGTRARLAVLDDLRAAGVLGRAEYRRFVEAVESGGPRGDFDP